MVSLVDFNIWRPNSPIRDVNHWTNYKSNLFMVIKTCIEELYFLEILIREEWSSNVPQILLSILSMVLTSVFPLRPVALLRLENPICSTIVPTTSGRRDGFMLFQMALVWREMQTASSRIWTQLIKSLFLAMIIIMPCYIFV